MWLFILLLFKHQGYLKENKHPINRVLSVGITSLVVYGERFEFERRGKRQKTRTSSFCRKDQISLLFVLFHEAWHCLKAPVLQKGLKGPLFHSVEWFHSDYTCLKYTFFLSWQTYVRDIYPFRRSVSPQLNLVQMHPEKGQELIQKQVTHCHQILLPRSKPWK